MKILAITKQSDRPESALLLGLAQKGHEIYFAGKPHPEFISPFIRAGIEIDNLKITGRFDFSASKLLSQRIKKFDPQIVHAFSGAGLAAAVRCKSRQSHFRLVAYRGTVGHLSRLDPAARLSYLSPKVDAISCVSQAVKDYLLTRQIPEAKLKTIYKGHDLAWYQNHSSLCRTDFAIPADDFLVVCVANARPVKGVDVLIEAANLLSPNCNISFLIVGEIRDKKLLKMARNPKMTFLNFRSDAQAIIALSDVLVVPSRGREGLPKSLLEAFAQKKVVIASEVGGIPEVIDHEQDSLLVPPGDSDILAKAISFLSQNKKLAAEFGERANQKLQKKFSVRNMVNKTEELYLQMIEA